MATMRLVLLTDASFANVRGMKRQLGYLVSVMNDTGRVNIIHYSSARCKIVTRSVMVSEVHLVVSGFYQAFFIPHLEEKTMNREIELHAYIESNIVFYITAKDVQTNERRLQIDISELLELYPNGELTTLGWIPGRKNPMDGLTKQQFRTTAPLWNVMTSNTLALDPCGWASVANKLKVPGVSTQSTALVFPVT